MMNTVTFESMSGRVLRPDSELGLYLVSYDAAPPDAKTYYVDVDGADGAVDLSEWAGEIKYGMRTVALTMRDIEGRGHETLTQFLTGRRVKITFSDQPEWYFLGRCESNAESTRKRVTDQTYTFTCEPYKLAHMRTYIRRALGENALTMLLQAARKSVIPKITTESGCTLVYDGNTYNLAAGVHTVPQIIITDTPKTMQATGNGNLVIEWQDGVL